MCDRATLCSHPRPRSSTKRTGDCDRVFPLKGMARGFSALHFLFNFYPSTRNLRPFLSQKTRLRQLRSSSTSYIHLYSQIQPDHHVSSSVCHPPCCAPSFRSPRCHYGYSPAVVQAYLHRRVYRQGCQVIGDQKAMMGASGHILQNRRSQSECMFFFVRIAFPTLTVFCSGLCQMIETATSQPRVEVWMFISTCPRSLAPRVNS